MCLCVFCPAVSVDPKGKVSPVASPQRLPATPVPTSTTQGSPPQLLMRAGTATSESAASANGAHPFSPTGIGPDFFTPAVASVGATFPPLVGKVALSSLLQRQLMQNFYTKALQVGSHPDHPAAPKHTQHIKPRCLFTVYVVNSSTALIAALVTFTYIQIFIIKI